MIFFLFSYSKENDGRKKESEREIGERKKEEKVEHEEETEKKMIFWMDREESEEREMKEGSTRDSSFLFRSSFKFFLPHHFLSFPLFCLWYYDMERGNMKKGERKREKKKKRKRTYLELTKEWRNGSTVVTIWFLLFPSFPSFLCGLKGTTFKVSEKRRKKWEEEEVKNGRR